MSYTYKPKAFTHGLATRKLKIKKYRTYTQDVGPVAKRLYLFQIFYIERCADRFNTKNSSATIKLVYSVGVIVDK